MKTLYTVEVEREVDGRWIADVPSLPGVMTYGATYDEAVRKCTMLALRVIAERLESGEAKAEPFEITFNAA